MGHDLAALEAKLRSLQQTLGKVAGSNYAEQLIPIIHRPGWTTVAEFALVSVTVDAIQRQVDGLARHCEDLVAAAHKVGRN
jgi:hypothetical protein